MKKLQWSCRACVRGKLRRSAPDDEGHRRLYFASSDGEAMWPIYAPGRPDNNGFIWWLLSNPIEAYNEPALWMLYPICTDEGFQVVPVGRGDPKGIEENELQFTASVDQWEKSILTLLVERNKGKGTNLVKIRVPKEFEQPEWIGKQRRCRGIATRVKGHFELKQIDTLKAPPPRPRRKKQTPLVESILKTGTAKPVTSVRQKQILCA